MSDDREDMQPAPPPGGHDAVADHHARRPLSRRVATIAAIVVGVIAFIVAADLATSSPRLCASCHEMQPRAASWSESAHVQVTCVECHETPRPWYQTPRALVSRTALIGRDLYWHLSGSSPSSEQASETGGWAVQDANCLECHDPNREATSGFRILIKHAEHAERNGSCISCHVNTAHPDAQRGRPISLMAQCFTCHGTAEQPEASAECGVCHPNEYELRPASHKDAKWKRGHGRVAASDREQCTLCHTKESCTTCHGVEMPHPDGWARGATGHAASAQRDRAVCARCHDEKPDLCSMCHHKAYDPSQGTWVKQHYRQVRDEGAAFCFECHAPLFCVECHAS